MANEIVEVTREPRGKGLVTIRCVYLYDLAEYGGPIMIEATSTKVILQERNDLAPLGIIRYNLVPDAWLTAIDNGDAYYIVDDVPQEQGESLAQVLNKAKLRYAKGIAVIDQQRVRWANAGKKYNKPGGV